MSGTHQDTPGDTTYRRQTGFAQTAQELSYVAKPKHLSGYEELNQRAKQTFSVLRAYIASLKKYYSKHTLLPVLNVSPLRLVSIQTSILLLVPHIDGVECSL